MSGKLSCTSELLCSRNDEAQVKPNPDVRRGWLQETGRLSVLQERDRGGGESGDAAVWRAKLTLAASSALTVFSSCEIDIFINTPAVLNQLEALRFVL